MVTRPDARSGRGRVSAPSPVAALAREVAIPVLAPSSARDPEFADRLAEFAPQAGAVVAYGQLLPPRVLAIPPHGWINLHFSLLPAWRGAAPVPAAIAAGDEVTGATTFRLEAGLDTGPVFGSITEPIGPTQTAGMLLDRLAQAGARLLTATLDGIEDGSLAPRPQPADGVSYVGKLDAETARVRWEHPALAIERAIRAYTPAPGAWTESPWGRMILGPVRPVRPEPGQVPPQPGELIVERRRVLVGTGSDPVELGSVQLPGRRPTPAADWARGARPQAQARLGSPETGRTIGEPAVSGEAGR